PIFCKILYRPILTPAPSSAGSFTAVVPEGETVGALDRSSGFIREDQEWSGISDLWACMRRFSPHHEVSREAFNTFRWSGLKDFGLTVGNAFLSSPPARLAHLWRTFGARSRGASVPDACR